MEDDKKIQEKIKERQNKKSNISSWVEANRIVVEKEGSGLTKRGQILVLIL